MTAKSLSVRRAAVLLVLLSIGVLAVGCSSDSGPVTSKSSKYEVADDGAAGGSDASGQSAPARPAGGTGSGGLPDATFAPGGARPSAVPGRPASPAPRRKMPAGGSPDELLAHVEYLQAVEPTGGTPQEVFADYQSIQQEILAATDQLLASAAPEKTLVSAAHAKVGALAELARMGEDIRARLDEFAASLEQHQNAAVARIGLQIGFATRLEDLDAGKEVDPQQFVDDFAKLAAADDKDIRLLMLGNQAAVTLERRGHRQQAIETFQIAAAAFEDTQDEQLQQGAHGMLENSLLLKADISAKFLAAYEGQADAAGDFLATAKELMASADAAMVTLSSFEQMAMDLEDADADAAGQLYAAIGEAFAAHGDEDVVSAAQQITDKFALRSSLVGKPFTVEGVTFEGAPLDWSKYQDKVVLVDFWATWCPPCLEAMPKIKENYDLYHEQGFEVVGVNLDDNIEQLQRYMTFRPVPWPNVHGSTPQELRWNHPMVKKCGVVELPFAVLVGRDGNVLALNLNVEQLTEKLGELFPDASPPTPAPPENQNPEGAPEKAEDAKKPAEKTGLLLPRPAPRRAGPSFVGALAFPLAAVAGASLAAPAEEDEQDAEFQANLQEINPYSPPAGLSPAQLIDFIFTMQEKPATIQRRPGFATAIVEAADQILAADASERFQLIAAETKFEVLHKAAVDGDEQADAALLKFVQQMQDDPREKIAAHVRFFRLERRAIDADQVPLEQLPGLLGDLKQFFTDNPPAAAHLRMASSTVRAINRLEDDELREKYFAEFGGLFAKSKDKELARYGRKIANTPARVVTDLIGKPLQLAGTTALGTAFEWQAYRGKVVVIDFWATWCGPCVREMPRLKALYQARRQDNFEVVAVSLDEDLDKLGDYLEKNEIPWTNLVGNEARQLAAKYGIRAIPTMLLVDAEGKVTAICHNVEQIEKQLSNSVPPEGT